MESTIVNRFFNPIIPVAYDNTLMDVGKLDYVKQLLDSISDILPHNSYIVDYHKRNFLFISKRSVFLCGYTEEEVMRWGYDFFGKILSPEDLDRLVEINEAGFKLFYSKTIEERKAGSISYDLVFHRKDGSHFCVNHRLKPFLFTDDGNMWLAVCCIRSSANDKTGNLHCYIHRTQERFSYSFKTHNWQTLPPLELTEKELIVAAETDRGTPEKQLVDMLCCTRSNIRYYKSQIMKKTKTLSMREAIMYLTAHGIM